MQSNWQYTAAYSSIFLIFGVINGSVGPLIPFLAAESHRLETDYMFIFVAKSAGALITALFYKLLQHFKLTSRYHRIIMVVLILGALLCILFDVNGSPVWQGGVFSCLAGLAYVANLTTNCSVLMVARKTQTFLWISLCHGSFGVGCLIAPLLVNLLKTKLLYVPATLLLLLIPCFLFLSSPQEKFQENQRFEGTIQDQESIKQNNVSSFLIFFMALNFFLCHGVENINGGWIPSFATLSKIANKQTASIYATIFWSSFTASRFISPLIKTKQSIKLMRSTQFGVIAAITAIIIMHCGHRQFAIMMWAIAQGIQISGIFTLTLTVPFQFSFRVGQQQLGDSIIVMMVSQAVIAAPTGYFMEKISLNMFYYSVLYYSLIVLINSRIIVYILRQSAVEQSKGQSLQIQE